LNIEAGMKSGEFMDDATGVIGGHAIGNQDFHFAQIILTQNGIHTPFNIS